MLYRLSCSHRILFIYIAPSLSKPPHHTHTILVPPLLCLFSVSSPHHPSPLSHFSSTSLPFFPPLLTRPSHALSFTFYSFFFSLSFLPSPLYLYSCLASPLHSPFCFSLSLSTHFFSFLLIFFSPFYVLSFFFLSFPDSFSFSPLSPCFSFLFPSSYFVGSPFILYFISSSSFCHLFVPPLRPPIYFIIFQYIFESSKNMHCK